MTRALISLLILLAAVPALAADPRVEAELEQARREKAALQYDRALASLDRALRLGRSGPAELAAIYRLTGELAAGLDDPAAAAAHFQRLLVLEPDATLPPGTSPKIAAPFDAARAWLAERAPLRVSFAASWTDAPELVMQVESDPLAMVTGARARVRTPDGAETVVAGAGTLRLPAASPLAVVAAAVDEYGNELVVHGSWQVPITLAAPGRPAHRRPLLRRPSFWGATGAIVGVAAVYFAFDARDAQDDFDAWKRDGAHTYAQTEDVADRGRRSALLANIGFVAAGAAAAVAGVLYLIDAGGGETTVVPAPAPGGAALILRRRF